MLDGGVLVPSFACAVTGLAYSCSCVGAIIQMTSETAWLLSGLLLIFFFFLNNKKSIIEDYFKFIKTVPSTEPCGLQSAFSMYKFHIRAFNQLDQKLFR